MKSVLISIRPKWCEEIASGEKTIEVRKTAPKLDAPFKCYIYCTKQRMTRVKSMYAYLHINEPRVREKYGAITTWGRIGDVKVNAGTVNEHMSYGMGGKVIGEFVCDKVYIIAQPLYPHDAFVFEEYDTLNRPGVMKDTCLTETELADYLDGDNGYGWHISNIEIYDKPKGLEEIMNPEFGGRRACRPPQSWCYVD